MNAPATLGNSLWFGSNIPAIARFHRALNRPAETQLQLLRTYLFRNAGSSYGQTHRFSEIKNYHEFAARVPLNDYENLQSWIERIRRGENGVLTAERVTHLIPTSGSSSARKLIPFTAGLQGEWDRAIGPWIGDLYGHLPSVAFGTAYWSISPAIQSEESGTSAVPIGFEDDSSYLGGFKRRLVQMVMAVPPELRMVAPLAQFRYLTLLCLLRRPDLRLISVWHPFYLILLLEALPVYWSKLLDDVRTGGCADSDLLPGKIVSAFKFSPLSRRAKELKAAGPMALEKIWPQLKVISCWGDANAGFGFSGIQKLFPHALIQRKGLMATEAIVTIPFLQAHPLAINSHFFEFIDGHGAIRLAHELQEDAVYKVVVTTAGGLWRYRLGDQVQVTGFVGKTPSLRFMARSGNISDRFGEKLSEAFVAQAIQEAMTGQISLPRFVLLAPDEDPSGCRYTLYIQGDIPNNLSSRLETVLQRNPQYAWCRQLEQLKPPRVFRITSGGNEAFIARELSQGKRLGEIKTSPLSPRTGWTQCFQGDYDQLFDRNIRNLHAAEIFSPALTHGQNQEKPGLK
jgi:GH3 auxin-responsive promoter